MSIKKTTERELTLESALERLQSDRRAAAAGFDTVSTSYHNLSEAYGKLLGAIETACLWLEGRQPMMSRVEVASYLRSALARADRVRQGEKL